MAQYTAIFTKPYADGYENLPSQNTPITAETLNDKDDAIVNIESYLSQHDIPTYEEQTNTSGEFKTLSGGILGSCMVNLEPIQSGSGTPSPSNVRPITGHTAVEVTLSDDAEVVEDITVNLGGTYYSGKYDFVSGVLTVDKVGVDMGSLSWTLYQANIFTADVTGRKFGNFNILCSMYPVSASTTIGGMQDKEIKGSSDNNKVIIKDSSYSSDASALTTAVTGQQLVYELATPQTIQLTPQQIETLIGQNNISVPLEGQSLDSLTYRETMAWDDVTDVVDTRLPISAIGTDESKNDTASKAYSQGDYFYKNGIAKAKTGIAQGATFTLGTNYEIKTLAEILKALES